MTDTIVTPPVTPCNTQSPEFHYWSAKSEGIRLGFAMLPLMSADEKKPAVSFGYLTDFRQERQWRGQALGWKSLLPGACWLLDALAGSQCPDLDVLDVDDLADLPWAIQTFGPTPLTVSTGRQGGGVHLYYKRDPNRPRDAYGSKVGIYDHSQGVSRKTKVDHKSWHGYTIAPGSLHRSGLTYLARWNDTIIADGLAGVSPAMLNSLPVLDAAKIGAAREEVDPTGFFDPTSFNLSGRITGASAKSGGAAQSRDYRDEQGASVIPGGTWQGKSVAEVAASLGDGRHPIVCPYRDGGGLHQNHADPELTLLRVEGGKPISTSCAACNRNYVHLPGTGKVNARGAATASKTDPTGWLTPSGHLDPTVLLEKIVGVAKAARGQGHEARPTLVLEVGRGRGKTTATRDAVKRLASNIEFMQGRKPRVVTIAPTRTLVGALAKSFDLPYYEDAQGPIEGSVAVCTPSAYRVVTEHYDLPGWQPDHADAPIDVLVLEEIEQQVRSLHGFHLNDEEARKGWGALVRLVNSAHIVVCLDADAGPLTRHLLQVARRPEAQTEWLKGFAEARRDFLSYTNSQFWDLNLKRAIEEATKRNQTVAIYTASAPHAKILGKLYPDSNVLIGGTTLRTAEDFDLATINEWAASKPVFIYTPVLGTGVSIDVKNKFHSVWAHVPAEVELTTDAVLQAIYRVRHPISTTVHTCLNARATRPESWATDPDQVAARLAAKSARSESLVGLGRTFPPKSVFDPDTLKMIPLPGADSYSRAMAIAFAADKVNGAGWLNEAMEARITKMGWGYAFVGIDPADDADRKIVREAKKVAKEEVTEETVQAILTARDLPPEEAKQLRIKGCKGKSARDDGRALTKFGTRAFYGDVTHEIVAFDQKNRGRSKLRRWAYASAMAEDKHSPARGYVDELDAGELRRGVSHARQKHEGLGAKARFRIFREAGLEAVLAPTASVTTVDRARLPAFVAFAKSAGGAALFNLIGIRVHSDVDQKPMILIESMLDSVGIKMKSKRGKKGQPAKAATRRSPAKPAVPAQPRTCTADNTALVNFSTALRSKMNLGPWSFKPSEDDAFGDAFAVQRVDPAVLEAATRYLGAA